MPSPIPDPAASGRARGHVASGSFFSHRPAGSGPSLDDVVACLSRRRFRFTSEAELQRGLAAALAADDIPHAREVEIAPGDRIDFLAGDVGIEVKVDGALGAVTRQLHRYAQSDRLAALVLVSSRNRLANQPPTLNGKPLRVVLVGGLL